MSGICNEEHKCTITMAGSLESLLVDGDKYSAATTISAWCDAGHCYGSANPTVNATAPFEITCDKLTGTTACSATLAGAAEAIFVNGNAVGKSDPTLRSYKLVLIRTRALGMVNTVWILQRWHLYSLDQCLWRSHVLKYPPNRPSEHHHHHHHRRGFTGPETIFLHWGGTCG